MRSKSSPSPVVHRLLVAVAFFLLWFGSISFALGRDRILIDSGWRFQLGDPADVTTNVTVYPEISYLPKLNSSDINAETALQATRQDPVATHAGENVSFVMTNYNDSAWRQLDLPHDWAVELPFTNNTLLPANSDTNKILQHGDKPIYDPMFTTNDIGWYRHTFTLPAGDAGKTEWLEFDGIYRNALIWFNGHCIGRDVSGYGSINFDVTPYINAGGTNVLVVRVECINLRAALRALDSYQGVDQDGKSSPQQYKLGALRGPIALDALALDTVIKAGDEARLPGEGASAEGSSERTQQGIHRFRRQ